MWIGTLITAFITLIVLNLLTAEKKETRSLKRFICRAPSDFAILGALGFSIYAGLYIWIWIDPSQIENQNFDFLHPLLAIFVAFPCVLLLVAPIKGVWDVIVDNDDITIVKMFIFKKRYQFSQISHGKETRGGLKVYIYNRKRKAFFVDGMCMHYSNFVKRMEKEEKEIFVPELKE